MKNSIFSKAITILGAIAMLVGVAACGQSNDSTKATTDGKRPEKSDVHVSAGATPIISACT